MDGHRHPGRRKYRAFISYSHAHEVIARKFHRKLESYRPPKGVLTDDDETPRAINPVFRDRDELASASSLTDELKTALHNSEHLVVLCSPEAAASQWVNEEIRVFAAANGTEKIRPVIVSGDPPGCFPPALTELLAEPIAADLRDAKDGFSDGALKAIAGLMGVPFATLRNREAARLRRRTQINAALSIVFALLTVVAGTAAWRAYEELGRAESAIQVAVGGVKNIVDQVGIGAQDGTISTIVADDLLGAADAMAEGIVEIAPGNPELRREHGLLMIQFSRHYKRLGQTERWSAASAKAEQIFQELTADFPDDLDAQRWRAGAFIEQGDVALQSKRHAAALDAYQQALSLSQSLVERDPDQPDRQRAVAVALMRLGDLHADMGDWRVALGEYDQGLRMMQAQETSQPNDIALAFAKVGLARLWLGEQTSAIEAYAEGLAIAKSFAAQHPGHARVERLASFLSTGMAEALFSIGSYAEALDLHNESLAQARRHSARDPDDVTAFHDAARTLTAIGDTHIAMQEPSIALLAFEEAADIRYDLALRDDKNSTFARDLLAALWKLAEHDASNPILRWSEVVAQFELMDLRGMLSAEDDTAVQIANSRLLAAQQDAAD